MTEFNEIRLAHGGGGRLSQQLLADIFLPEFGNEVLAPLNDSALCDIDGGRVAFTTDSFVVKPYFFPGGDIGKLSVCGTVNDLAMVGARPRYISMGFILEEGFPVDDLKRIVRSARETADEAGVLISTGDTKVVERGNADGIYINTSGIGLVESGFLSSTDAVAGDDIIVNGPLGCHGMAVITSREDYGFKNRITSDVAPLNHLALDAMKSGEVHVMRDATRGGVATVLNEIAAQSGVNIVLDETALPVQEDVRGACELLGFDPLYVANEGVMVTFVSARSSQAVLQALKKHAYGRGAAKIGSVVEAAEGRPGRVTMKTTIGSHRILDMLSGEQLPRIC